MLLDNRFLWSKYQWIDVPGIESEVKSVDERPGVTPTTVDPGEQSL